MEKNMLRSMLKEPSNLKQQKNLQTSSLLQMKKILMWLKLRPRNQQKKKGEAAEDIKDGKNGKTNPALQKDRDTAPKEDLTPPVLKKKVREKNLNLEPQFINW